MKVTGIIEQLKKRSYPTTISNMKAELIKESRLRSIAEYVTGVSAFKLHDMGRQETLYWNMYWKSINKIKETPWTKKSQSQP